MFHGFASCSPLEQRLRRTAAQQQPCPLGAVQPLVSRHGNKSRPGPGHGKGQTPRGLRRVYNQRNPLIPAQVRHLFHRQYIAKHIGYMGADHHVYFLRKLPAELLHELLRTEKRSCRHFYIHSGNRRQGPCHGVVFISGDEHSHPGFDQCFNGQIQAVSCVKSQHHSLWVIYFKQLRRQLTAGIGRFRRPAGRQMPAPPGTCQMLNGPGGGPGHSGRLLQCGGSTVKIDHSVTSR